LPDVVVALAFGILVRNVFGATWSLAGAQWSARYMLRAAIILIGGGLTVSAVASRGAEVVGLVVCLAAGAFAIGIAFARIGRLTNTMGILIGAGTAICGASAILLLSPLVRARDEETAYAIATIFAFNLIALVSYPVIGHLLHLSQAAFGIWTGTAVNDTSIVVATGFAYGPMAGTVATVTKLTRTLLLVPLAIGIGFAFIRGRGGDASIGDGIRASLPWFIGGFLLMAAVHSSGLLPAAVFEWTSAIASFLIVVVLASVGLGVELRSLRAQGLQPMGIGLALGTLMAATSLLTVELVRPI
jgi:uncharacterized integral membrane protein (TIGR00698 family)